jgi:hypothetical protein
MQSGEPLRSLNTDLLVRPGGTRLAVGIVEVHECESSLIAIRTNSRKHWPLLNSQAEHVGDRMRCRAREGDSRETAEGSTVAM